MKIRLIAGNTHKIIACFAAEPILFKSLRK